MRLGLFDIFQVDPLDPATDAEVYRRHLDHLALADDLGYAVAFTAERHFLPTYRCPAPFAWLGAASQRTSRIRLGTLAHTLPIHAPAALAEEIAVLDHLTGGRIEVGLGLGHRAEELVALGLDPRFRAHVYQERLAVLKALWAGGQVSLETPLTTVRDLAIHPLPVQRPYPPLWYPGTDPGAAAWAAGEGMSLAIGFAPTAALQSATRAFADARRRRDLDRASSDATRGDTDPAEAADHPARIALMRHVYVAEDDDRARAEMTDDLRRLHEHLNPGNGTGEGGRADREREAADAIAEMGRDETVIAGGPETVAAKLETARRALDLDVFLANPYLAGIDDERVRRTLSLLAEVLPDGVTAPGREEVAVG